MSSFGILKTNVGLTSNVKVMIGVNSDMYLDSIESDSELSSTKYKKIKFNKDSKYDSLIPLFYKGLPSDIAFKIKYDNDVSVMYNDFKYQYDDTYIYGSRNILNKNYDYDYEYFAPLYIDINKLPKEFIVFRIDGSGIINSNKENFNSEILQKMKCVSHYDLTTNSDLGKWLDNSFVSNSKFPMESLYFDYRDGYFTQWNGINYKIGGYTTMSSMLNDDLYISKNFHEMETLIMNGFKNNGIIYPNIINFSFMFNDTPATKSNLRKWSINRYLGFYMNDVVKHTSVTPFRNVELKPGITIGEDNVLFLNGEHKNIEPFVPDFKKYEKYYIEIGGVFYELYKREMTDINQYIVETQISSNNYIEENINGKYYEWKILSDISFNGLTNSDINTKRIQINSENEISYSISGEPIIDEITFSKNDMWIINIDGKYHRLLGEYINNVFINKIHSDYGFEISDSKFKYFINLVDPNYTTTINLDKPITFGVFKCIFSDLKEFDSDIVETNFARFELDNNDDLIDSNEPKLYVDDFNSKTIPLSIDEYKIGSKIISIPVASEYTASGEMYQIENNTLNSVWRKNQIGLKWGFKNSISAYDYPYLLNNSQLADDSNRTASLMVDYVSEWDRNLDYFYTLADNSKVAKYDYQSLMIYTDSNISKIGFNYSRYFSDEDYFNTLFKSYEVNKKGDKLLTNKYSIFNNGDNVITNNTLFRGLKFNIYNVNNIILNDDNLSEVSTSSSSEFDGYKFSIIATTNATNINRDLSDKSLLNQSEPILSNQNAFNWEIVKELDFETPLYTGDIILDNDILYRYIGTDNFDYSNDVDFDVDFEKYPNIFEFLPLNTIYYNPSNIRYANASSTSPELVYHMGNYYYYNLQPQSDEYFWCKNVQYSNLTVVFYDGNFYQRIDGNNGYTKISPDLDNETWSRIEKTLGTGGLFAITNYEDGTDSNSVLYLKDDIVYKKESSISYYKPYYYMESNNMVYYGYDNTLYLKNNLIEHNNKIYIQIFDINQPTSKLDNGIDILINKRKKNIIINIYCNDSTYDYSPGESYLTLERNKMYIDIFNKMVASNFVNSVNSLIQPHGFSNNIRYIIVDNDIRVYDVENITNLPYIIQCDVEADLLTIKTKSKVYKPYNISNTIIKPSKVLDKGILPDFEYIEYFNNNMPVGVTISDNNIPTKEFNNYHGLTDNSNSYLFRYSGPYEPIFKTISLFEVSDSGNVRFDTTLTEFGITSERVISKVNREQNILKLKNIKNYKSIFPIYDEFGYTIIKSYMFKSTWDTKYYIECKKNI